ncbi:leucyl/phenylalanyl-tRNA--protein transferase [Acetitomaculum ruminis DSM 5522]|uniref:Leucyl/phenylalanyl-tRNA--protein transferase n=1 Tax=Acetitomaculum ruminis DSM 5522 TaxID=1120918 RepID=A0A1I0ZNT1_9FIRM|nr:leucyl/phenylalanyl-tRNA--protein transferase [Acetitomaculum ruminis]SFB27157.1 leucyl/phenylalanyl-tRNA--protein transferase [Acetitomaculum ruminis DSM 5522]
MPVYRLPKKEITFPLPEMAEESGLLAIGGDLSLDRLLLAYCNGIFPWYNPGDEIMWWCPGRRFIIRPSKIHISHSMKKFMKKHETKIVINRDFKETMHRCRLKREFNEGTWIGDDMEDAYYKLFKAGYATSVESFIDNKPAGGLYGVAIGRCFFGESMYSDMENGSKLALILLAKKLEKLDYQMIDCQFYTKHLESMGGEYISFEEYKNLLDKGIGSFF